MPITEEPREFLEEHDTVYMHHIHRPACTAREVARAEHIAPHRMAKTIVFHSDRGYGMAILPADSHIDLFELRFALGLGQLRLPPKASYGICSRTAKWARCRRSEISTGWPYMLMPIWRKRM